MNTIDRGGEIVGMALALLAVVAVWGCCAHAVLTERGRRQCSNPMLATAIFLSPLFCGLCWVVGWLAGGAQ